MPAQKYSPGTTIFLQDQESNRKSVEEINSRLQKAERTYSETPRNRRCVQLQRLVDSYQEAMEFYKNETSSDKRVQLQEEISRVQETISLAYSELQIGPPMPPKPPSLLTRFMTLPLAARAGLLLLMLLVVSGSVWAGLNFGTSLAEGTCVSGNLHIDGSTALEPLISKVADDYHQVCPNASVSVTRPASASITGLENVENGSIDIGDSDIFSFPAQKDLVDHQVAAVTFALIVNQDVGAHIQNLKTDDIREIFTGAYTNWKQLQGPDLPIIPLSRTTNSGSRYTFETYILHGVQTILQTEAPASTTVEAAQEVANTPGAIGYTTLYQATNTPSVKIVSIDGVPPEEALVRSGTYHFWNIEHMYTKGSPAGLKKAFLNYVYDDAPKEIHHTFKGFLSIADMTPQMLKDRNST